MTSGLEDQPATPGRIRSGCVARKRLTAAIVGLLVATFGVWPGVHWHTVRNAAATLAEVREQIARGETVSARARLQRLL